MRVAIYVGAVVAIGAAEPALARGLLASGAAVLLESLPYLALSSLLVPVAGKLGREGIAFAGCGCTAGASARSIPAAIALSFVTGPLPALARVAAAVLTSRIFHPAKRHDHTFKPLSELASLAPAALIAAALLQATQYVSLAHRPWIEQFLMGAILGFFAAPCALASVAIAATLHSVSPIASIAYLCIAGIADARTFSHGGAPAIENDAWAYLVLGAACILCACERGAALVHPKLSIALIPAAGWWLHQAWRCRKQRCASARWFPCVAFAALVIGAPAPVYTATETTLAGAFPGEHLDFTGMLVKKGNRTALVRYAITCCRADAQPVAIALTRGMNARSRGWIHASGVIVRGSGGELALDVQRADGISPPADPFTYR
jgi:hypothetical protein